MTETRISTPDEVRAVRALASGSPVVVMGYAFRQDGELAATLYSQYDILHVKVDLGDGRGPHLVVRASVRPAARSECCQSELYHDRFDGGNYCTICDCAIDPATGKEIRCRA